MKKTSSLFLVVFSLFFGSDTAFAWHSRGCVYCDISQDGRIGSLVRGLANVTVNISNSAGTIFSGVSGPDGCFFIDLPDPPDSYTETLDAATLPVGAAIVMPAGGEYSFALTDAVPVFSENWLIESAACREQLCWMTGGGVKFERITGTWNAECQSKGPTDTVGGVVYPSCSQFPSNGGQWNHVAHSLKLHLTGADITVLRCGNVPDIPPGTESPVCDHNFIEWVGTGRLSGIGGNKFGPIDVSFFGHVEDRNEPGNEQSAKSGDDIDRYFLRVVDGSGTVHILVDSDGVDDGSVDPVTITGGNFQIHCTSCD